MMPTYSVIDLTGGRRRRIPPPGIIDLTSAPRLQQSDIRPMPVFGPNLPSARLGGARFTGSTALDILARRRITPRPAAPAPAPVARPAAAPAQLPKPKGGYFGARGKVGKVSKNALHGRGDHYVYKSRRKKRLFDSAGSYSLEPKKSKSKPKSSMASDPKSKSKSKSKSKQKKKRRRRSRKPAAKQHLMSGDALRSQSKLRHTNGGTKKVSRSDVLASRNRATADLIKIASALRRKDDRRLRAISASINRQKRLRRRE